MQLDQPHPVETAIAINPATTARQTLDLPLPEWHALLQGWAASGELVAAAREALQLPETPAALSELAEQWAAGVFEAMPPIVLLPASSMPGAAGVYAISTGTIYFNADWLATASQQQRLAVLTEELGHHLDGLLNEVDTPGDKGELFSALLMQPHGLSSPEQQALRHQQDHACLPRASASAPPLAVELAVGTPSYQLRSTAIPPASPGRSHQEARNRGAIAALHSDGSVVT